LDARPRPSLLLIGPTGSGKTPLGDELERRGFLGRRCVHFDFGANLRAIAAAPEKADVLTATECESVRTSLATGALFEDKDMPMIVKIVKRFVEARDLTPEFLLVLNGLPRHRRQAEGLAGVVAVERVVYLEAGAEVIRERMRLDPGGDRSERIDDTLEAVERRLAAFRKRTVPLVSYYRERGALVAEIPVTASMTAARAYQALVERLSIRKEPGHVP
jgi:adenylate kinase family enzyme